MVYIQVQKASLSVHSICDRKNYFLRNECNYSATAMPLMVMQNINKYPPEALLAAALLAEEIMDANMKVDRCD